MRYIAIAAGLTLLSTACAEVKSRRSVEEAIKADTAIIINISRDVQRGDYSSLRRAITANTTLRIDGRDMPTANPDLVTKAIAGCRLRHHYAFGGNGLNPSAWKGETVIITDWACPLPYESDGDSSWTFSFENGELRSLSNDPVML